MTTHKEYPYTLVNRSKSEEALRAVMRNNRNPNRKYETTLLAEYDRRGGLLTLDTGEVVRRGTFWDFENNCPHPFGVTIPGVTPKSKSPKNSLLGRVQVAVKWVANKVRRRSKFL